jgi:phosphoribosylpyrophosphate synthetase
MDSETVKRLKDRRVIFLAYFTFNEPSATTIIDQIIFLNSLSHYGVAEINIVLPYFPVGTMERIVGEGEIPTAYSLAHMLNSIPEGTSKNKIYIFDIHALCSRFFFHTNTVPTLITMMPLYTKYITETFRNTEEQTNINIIVFPDDGAKKRFEKVLPKEFLKITCSKERIGNERRIKIDEGLELLLQKINEGNANNKSPVSVLTHKLKDGNINLFIIDDLVQSGGTLQETVKGIQDFLSDFNGFNATNIHFYPIVTHAVFPNDKNKVFFDFSNKKNRKGGEIKIDRLITTDSRPTKVAEMKNSSSSIKDKIEVIGIAEPLFEIFTGAANANRFIAPYSIK